LKVIKKGENMGKWLSLMLVLLLVPSVVAVSVDEFEREAGTPPDSLFYKIDRIFERVQLLFSRSDLGKAETRLGFARERLAEFKVMLDKGRTEQAEIALEEYLLNIKYARDFSFNTGQDFKDAFDSEAKVNVEFLDSLEVPEEFVEAVEEAAKASKVVRSRVKIDSPFLDTEIPDSPFLSDAVRQKLMEAQEEEAEPEVVEEAAPELEEVINETEGIDNTTDDEETEAVNITDLEPVPEPEPEPEEEEYDPSSDTLGVKDPSPIPGYH
jgi:hypothetical protein